MDAPAVWIPEFFSKGKETTKDMEDKGTNHGIFQFGEIFSKTSRDCVCKKQSSGSGSRFDVLSQLDEVPNLPDTLAQLQRKLSAISNPVL